MLLARVKSIIEYNRTSGRRQKVALMPLSSSLIKYNCQYVCVFMMCLFLFFLFSFIKSTYTKDKDERMSMSVLHVSNIE